eukprot:CAMPEP_0116559484 /NCGR_PEP_ID=MMETSP0397-20121206/10424_1 /TAXON_ID=216820 /ORGANISM="Cyclophora tenuis, Strain ECT3854" /LENGTH=141 /DNA_ID=CAMNT_0004085263 /DNA_START=65 /DNA_END=490 /DNA_ORIENTATION=+
MNEFDGPKWKNCQQRFGTSPPQTNNETNPWPVLVLGDLNADPPTEQTRNTSAVQLLVDNNRFTSAYDLENSSENDPPLFTTWKTRGNRTARRVIDYIFYSGLVCTHTLSLPHKALEEERYKLPNLRYPSDHLMIAAKFRLP